MRFLIHLLQLWCWMQSLLSAIIWDLSWVLHKNWNTQTPTRFGWLLGSSWFFLGKAARAAWAGCWQPQPCSFPSRWHKQPKESWRELHISFQKAARGYRFKGFHIWSLIPEFSAPFQSWKSEWLKKKRKKAMANCFLLNLVIKPTASMPCFMVIWQHFWFNLYYLISVFLHLLQSIQKG